MAEITPIQLLRGTAAQWTSANPTLASGKPGFETDTKRLKIGDGATAWISLRYIDDTKADAKISTTSKTGSYTLAAAELVDVELGKSLLMLGNSTGDLTVPANATIAFGIGTVIGVQNFNNVVAAGGVTITGTNGGLTLATGQTGILKKTDVNVWEFSNGQAATGTAYGATSGTNTYTVTLSPALAALSTGVSAKVKISTASTGASTLNPNGLGAKKIFKNPTTQAGNGDLLLNYIYDLIYDATLDSAAGGWLVEGSIAASSTPADYYGGTSGTNTYTAVLSPTLGALATGVSAKVKFNTASTAASTFNPDGLGAKKIFKSPTVQAGNGDLVLNQIYDLVYDATLDSAAGGWLVAGGINVSSGAAWGSLTGTLSAQTDLQAALDAKADKLLLRGNADARPTASYTLVLGDAGKLVETDVATAHNVTVPLNSSVAYPIRTQILIGQYNAGQVTIVATGGVTIRSVGSRMKLFGQYSQAALVKIGTDEWWLTGDLVA